MNKVKKYVVFVVAIVAIALGVVFVIKHNATKSSDKSNNASSSNSNNTNSDTANDLEKFNYEFNPHVISKEYLQVYGADIEETFYRFCDAVLNGENTFACASQERLNAVLSIARYCLPVGSAYVDSDKCYVEGGIAYLTYTVSNEELLTKVEEFKAKVTEVITAAVPYKEDDLILAMELLTAVANKDDYDDEGIKLDNFMTCHPYKTIMQNIGICQEIAGEYIYYLLQVGINATTCDGMDQSQEYAHMWAIVEIDGEHFHVDPTFTIEHKDGLAFFCLDDERRAEYGDFNINDLNFSESDVVHYTIDSKKYKELWNAETYTIDHEKRIINYTVFYSGEKREYKY